MMINRQSVGLKGQFILAQGNPGKTGRRPGFENGRYNRPRDNVHQRENLISDETENLLFPENDVLQFPRHTGAGCPKK